MELIKKFDREKFKKGILDSKGIAIAFAPFGLTLGLLANAFNVSKTLGIMMTFIIYSGASQALLLKIFSNNNFDILSVVFAAAILNFRYVLINIPVFKLLKTDKKSKALLSLILTDEIVAFLTINKKDDPSYAFGVEISGYMSFCFSAFLGVLIGSYIPLIVINSMKFMLYGTFLSLLISSLMIEFKSFKIVLITSFLKLLFIFVSPFNMVSDGIEIVSILVLTSLIYALIEILGDRK